MCYHIRGFWKVFSEKAVYLFRLFSRMFDLRLGVSNSGTNILPAVRIWCAFHDWIFLVVSMSIERCVKWINLCVKSRSALLRLKKHSPITRLIMIAIRRSVAPIGFLFCSMTYFILNRCGADSVVTFFVDTCSDFWKSESEMAFVDVPESTADTKDSSVKSI